MPDLSKLPWDECALPEFNGCSYSTRFIPSNSEDITIFQHKRLVAWRTESMWTLCGIQIDELEQIAKMCRIVENFIKEHS